MGVIFIDGFDHYGASSLDTLRKKWDNVTSTGIGINTTSPRTGSGKLLVTGNGAFVKKLFTAADRYIVGFGFRRNTAGGGSAFSEIFGWETVDFDSIIQIQYQHTTESFRIGFEGGFIPGTAGPIDVTNTWVYLELDVDIAAGSYEFRVDGVTLLSGTGGFVAQPLEWMKLGNMVAATFDDLYLLDVAKDPYPNTGTGPVNQDFIGPCNVYTLWPIDSGPVNDGVGSDGNSVNNHELVDDGKDTAAAHDEDATYVALTASGHKDLYVPDDTILPEGVEVHAVQVTAFAKRVGLDFEEYRPVIMDSGGTWTSNGEFNWHLPGGDGSDSYGITHGIWDRDPNNATGQIWTKALVEARRYGGQWVP